MFRTQSKGRCWKGRATAQLGKQTTVSSVSQAIIKHCKKPLQTNVFFLHRCVHYQSLWAAEMASSLSSRQQCSPEMGILSFFYFLLPPYKTNTVYQVYAASYSWGKLGNYHQGTLLTATSQISFFNAQKCLRSNMNRSLHAFAVRFLSWKKYQ